MMVRDYRLVLSRMQYPTIEFDSDYYFIVYHDDEEGGLGGAIERIAANESRGLAVIFLQRRDTIVENVVTSIKVGIEEPQSLDYGLSTTYRETADALLNQKLWSMLLEPAWDKLEPALQAEITKRRLLA